MARRPSSPSLFNPFALWMDLNLKTAEMLMASGQAQRTQVVDHIRWLREQQKKTRKAPR